MNALGKIVKMAIKNKSKLNALSKKGQRAVDTAKVTGDALLRNFGIDPVNLIKNATDVVKDGKEDTHSLEKCQEFKTQFDNCDPDIINGMDAAQCKTIAMALKKCVSVHKDKFDFKMPEGY